MSQEKKPTMKRGEISKAIDRRIEVCLDSDFSRYSNGFLHMGITSVDVKRDGQSIGTVTMNVQGTAVHMSIGASKCTWSINIQELIPLFLEADKQHNEDE